MLDPAGSPLMRRASRPGPTSAARPTGGRRGRSRSSLGGRACPCWSCEPRGARSQSCRAARSRCQTSPARFPGSAGSEKSNFQWFREFCKDARPVGRLDAWASSSRQRLPSRRSDAVVPLRRCRFAGRASPPAGASLGAAGALLAATSRVTSLTAVALLNEITTALPLRASSGGF